MDLSKLLDNAKQTKGNKSKPPTAPLNGNGGISVAKKATTTSVAQPIRKAQSTPTLSVFNPPKSLKVVASVPEEVYILVTNHNESHLYITYIKHFLLSHLH